MEVVQITGWLRAASILTLGYCNFRVRIVYSGGVDAYGMCGSNGNADYYSRELFPVVTLSSELLSGNATNEFIVK